MSFAKYSELILGVVVSEKSNTVLEQHNRYVFRVIKTATKEQIRQAIAFMFQVKVESVNVLNRKGKQKRFGRFLGKRSDTRLAYVTLAVGSQINLLEV